MIELTEQELKIVLEKLKEIPLKDSLELFTFFVNKTKEKQEEKEDGNDTTE